jgi:hypothetical protein
MIVALSGCLAPDAIPGPDPSGTGGAGGGTTTAAGGSVVDPLAWAQAYGPDGSFDQRAWSVASSAKGEAIVAGDFEGSFAVGALPVLPNTTGRDAFVLQLDPGGQPQWIVGFAGDGDQRAYAVAATSDAGVLVAGSFTNALGFAGEDLDMSPQGMDGFVASLDDKRALRWLLRVDGAGDQAVHTVAATPDGGALLGGVFELSLHVGDITIDGEGQGRQIFVAKLDGSGKALWAKALGGDPPQLTPSLPACILVADADGSAHLAATFGGTLHFGQDIGAAGDHDLFLGKLDASGNPVWGHAFGAQGAEQRAAALAVDGKGRAVLAADLRGKVTLGNATLEAKAGSSDALIAMFDAGGAAVWASRYGSAADDRSSGVAFDKAGNVYFTGEFRGTIDFGTDTALQNDEAVSKNDDIFFAKLTPDGKALYGEAFGEKQSQVATSLAADPDGHALLTGYFNGFINFGGGDLDAKQGTDIFIAKLGK